MHINPPSATNATQNSPLGWSPLGTRLFKLNNAARLGFSVANKTSTDESSTFATCAVKEIDDLGNVTVELSDGSEDHIPRIEVAKRIRLENVRDDA